MRQDLRLVTGGAELLPDALAVRLPVFVEEQGVPAAVERDEHDLVALHVVAYAGQAPVATGRCYETAPGTVRIGRMAVLAGQRRQGIGSLILTRLEAAACEHGASEAVLHAQWSARGFYATAGYEVSGEPYDEAGLLHITMRRMLVAD